MYVQSLVNILNANQYRLTSWLAFKSRKIIVGEQNLIYTKETGI